MLLSATSYDEITRLSLRMKYVNWISWNTRRNADLAESPEILNVIGVLGATPRSVIAALSKTTGISKSFCKIRHAADGLSSRHCMAHARWWAKPTLQSRSGFKNFRYC
jgi:hypothetical protein